MYNTKKVEEALVVMETKMPTQIVDQTTYDEAVAFGKQVSKMEKFIEGEEKKITAPLNESLKAVRSLFKPYKEKCATVKNTVKSYMVAYLAEETKKQREQEAKDLARLERGTIKEDTVVKKMLTRELEKTTTTGTTTKILVIKGFDLSKVPVEYLLLNESKVKADYREGKEIAGVELEYEVRARL
ncbi:TPA: hypothetical protein DEP58_01560 [Patescibacteria group bacterium]|nr:hypothetical protein [Patescibacteria group bacterium]